MLFVAEAFSAIAGSMRQFLTINELAKVPRDLIGGIQAMRHYAKKCLAVVAVLLFAAVVWASTRTDSTQYDVTQPMKIGNTQLKPGHYTLKANESKDQLRVLRNGALVATVPCHWIKLKQKANNSEILSTKNRVTRVEFHGRRDAISVG
jgi:hypothetical protein